MPPGRAAPNWAGEVNFNAGAGNTLPDGLIADHIRDLARKARTQGAGPLDQTLCCDRWPTGCAVPMALRIRQRHADKARSPWHDRRLHHHVAPIAGLDAPPTAREIPNGITGDGMAVAMYTTLAGLVGSILLKVQYYMLDAATARVFARRHAH
jgi:hypothetical protein